MVKVYLRDRECRFYTVRFIRLGGHRGGAREHGLFGMRSFPEFEAVTRAAVFQRLSPFVRPRGLFLENFNLWPSITLVIILMFMLMGGCAGSTGGGVKVMRLVMLFRLAYLKSFRLSHPHSVRHLKIAGEVRAR